MRCVEKPLHTPTAWPVTGCPSTASPSPLPTSHPVEGEATDLVVEVVAVVEGEVAAAAVEVVVVEAAAAAAAVAAEVVAATVPCLKVRQQPMPSST